MTRGFMTVAVAGLLMLGAGIFVSCSTESEAKVAEIKLPTAQCMMCEDTISGALKKVDGVKDVQVDGKKRLARVTFLPAITSVEKLELAVTTVGYDANDRKADPKAYSELDGCCQVPGAK